MRLLFALLFFQLTACAQIVGVEKKVWLNQRWGHGVEFITGTPGGGNNAVLENSLVPDSGKIKIFYTGSNTSGQNSLYMSVATNMDSTPTLIGRVLGLGVTTARNVNCSKVTKIGDTLYAFAPNGYNSNTVYKYKSITGGYTWTDGGTLVTTATIPGLIAFGNIEVVGDSTRTPVLIGGKYIWLIEGQSGFHWQLHLLTSTNINGPLTYVKNLTTLSVFGGSYSGASATLLDNRIHLFYHYSPNSSGVLPTFIAYAYSDDTASTWTQRERPMKYLESLPYGPLPATPNYSTGTSQIADWDHVPFNGYIYGVAEYFKNSNPVEGVLYRWRFRGTFRELISDLRPCIGCRGVYP
jgi:hypothetical protein